MATIAAIGEVMVELSPSSTNDSGGRELMALSFAGDTYNTAVYMARLGLTTDYVTHLGDDPYSAAILQRMAQERIGSQLIQQRPGRAPGLYMIRNSANGEREFFYWRNEAPARELFNSTAATEQLFAQLQAYDCVYLTGITLAIIDAAARSRLYECLQQLRAHKVRIAFDSNYRPRLWRDPQQAQAAILQVMQLTDIALLTLDDEQLLWGDDSLEACRQRYAQTPVQELILKRGAQDAVIVCGDEPVLVPVPPVAGVVDTTGAGDSFNAGYLAARLQGESPHVAVQQAIRCAGIVIRHRGAIIDKASFSEHWRRVDA